MQPAQRERETMLNRVKESASEAYHGVTDRASHLRESTEHYVQQTPLTASLVSFGVGVGLGLFLAQMLVPPRRQPRWYDSYLGQDRAHNMEHTLQRYLPNSFARRMGM